MNTLITIVTTIVLFVGSIAKPCFAQQTTSTTSTSMVKMPAGTAYKLTVVVQEVARRAGKIYIGLANSASTFDGESLQRVVIDVPASGEVSASFEGLAPGRYAVRLYQDLNDNQKMDFSGQMPTEPFGFSNVTRLMGPPTFDQCVFDLAENKTIQIDLMSL
jgi:uncharacterized protein (DUF2141 family)